MTNERASGLLLHITSLPSKYGIGDLGPEAYRFADFLLRARQRYWQILPLSQLTLSDNGYSPYNGLSAFAGNTMLISPQLLLRKGLLGRGDVLDCPSFPDSRVDYRRAVAYKTRLLNAAYERFKHTPARGRYKEFCSQNVAWLDDFALFTALRERFGWRSWCDWPAGLRDRQKGALNAAKAALKDAIGRAKFLQYVFFEQWDSLKRYCNRCRIRIIGDIPIYVAYTSADVWSHHEVFVLTPAKKPKFVSGTPPDAFSRAGQLWGNPLYNWRGAQDACYRWWVARIAHNLALFDVTRIDHFRGFFACWQVPAGKKTAAGGKWVKGPGERFFAMLSKRFPRLPIIAEDLGHITPDVKGFVEKSGIPGMKVLVFAFGGNPATNTHCPHNHIKNCVVYTGTHDTDTVAGWFRTQADAEQKRRVLDYIGRKTSSAPIHREFIRLALGSVAFLAIIPVQDVLGLGSAARMNRPATTEGNWRWRLEPGQLTPQIAARLAEMVQTYARS